MDAIEKTFPRLWSLEAGTVMVVTDLHGDWDTYQRYRDCFVDLQAKGRADYLVFTGDLIHREDESQVDQSVEIVLDVLDLQARYGPAVIYISGNHELPHIYGISLSKGNRIYTPTFEKALNQSQARSEIITLFQSLPFFVRTRAGVSITHAGASPPLADLERARLVFNWNHQELLAWADQTLAAQDLESLRQSYASRHQVAYDLLAAYYLDVFSPADPRYNDLVRGFVASTQVTFERILWPVLFTRCEAEYPLNRKDSLLKAVLGKFFDDTANSKPDYGFILEKTLNTLSLDFFPQNILVAGHINVEGGYQIIAKKHLRLASGFHATPLTAGQYLRFDAGQPLKNLEDLLRGLGSVFI